MTPKIQQQSPPPVLHSARTIWYAVKDEDIVFTDRIDLYVDGERLGEVPCLAICENYSKRNEIILEFCDLEWNSKGVIAFQTVEEAKAKAERGYQGISAKWINAEASKEEVDRYLREVYEVDPDTEWWQTSCSFCGKEDVAVAGKDARICEDCIKECYRIITEEKGA
jgi:hypothetical protein